MPVAPTPCPSHTQGWNFGRFLVLLGFRRLYSLSGKYFPSIPFPIEPEIPGTQSTRLRPQFHTESLIGKPKILNPRPDRGGGGLVQPPPPEVFRR